MIEDLMERTDPGTAVVDAAALAALDGILSSDVPGAVPDAVPVDLSPRLPALRWAGFALAAAVVIGGILAVPLLISSPFEAPVGSGDYPHYATQQELENAASAILVVDVLSEAPGSFEGIDAEVKTVKVVADAADVHPVGEVLEIKEMPGEDALNVGGRFVVFIEEYDNGVPASLLNPTQGAYLVDGNTARPLEGNEVLLDTGLLSRLGIGETRPD